MYSSNIYLHCVSLIHKPMLVSIKSISIFLLCVLKSSWGPPNSVPATPWGVPTSTLGTTALGNHFEGQHNLSCGPDLAPGP